MKIQDLDCGMLDRIAKVQFKYLDSLLRPIDVQKDYGLSIFLKGLTFFEALYIQEDRARTKKTKLRMRDYCTDMVFFLKV